MTESYCFMVEGKVQGVGFRLATRSRARALGLSGWVRNRGDGRVEGRVTGKQTETLEAFRRFLDHGPAAARVDAVLWEPCAPLDETGFEIHD